ncbi:Tn3 family transposase [Streptomyces sp. NPDC059814]|uniref:Tn3 family transposase n=1 Tax=Streptomyces sp. NPDC059814 TaxID=3346959 RepID=UPI0036600032
MHHQAVAVSNVLETSAHQHVFGQLAVVNQDLRVLALHGETVRGGLAPAALSVSASTSASGEGEQPGNEQEAVDRPRKPHRSSLPIALWGKFNALLTNAVIFHNALDIAEIIRPLLEEGWEIEPEDLAHISPYLTEHIKRFGEYSTHELGIQPEVYETKLDVDFTQLREQDLTAAGLGQAA